MSNWPTKLFDFAKTCGKKLTSDETTTGQNHAQVHTVNYYLDGIQYGKGEGSTMSKARMAAAEMAYKALSNQVNGH